MTEVTVKLQLSQGKVLTGNVSYGKMVDLLLLRLLIIHCRSVFAWV